MRISEICIQRPVFATVMSLVLTFLGAVSYERLSVREYPKIDEPVVTIETKFAGASADIIETQVTKVIEDSVAGIEGIDVLTSFSRAETSSITLRFKLERDADSAAADVRDRTSRVRARLPVGVDEPVIAKVEADANPIIWLAFSSENMSALDVSDTANRIVKPLLQTLPGAADVRVFGERRYAMRIWLDKDQLASYKLTPLDVEDALRKQNIEIPSGRIESQQREFTVVSQTDLTRVSEFENVILRSGITGSVRLGDVATIKVAPQSERSFVRFNGRNAISLGVIKQATANPLILAKAVREALPAVKAQLPPGMAIDVANDSTVFIDKSIQSVYKTAIEAIVLVALVIFVFLRSIRASLIPLVTIPVCLIGTFTLMLVAGFSINTLTLLSLVLAIGLVVDDAIVVLENIYRHIEDGMEPIAASVKGIREVGFAVVAMTLTLAAVYAPVVFTPGRTGRLFIEFALTLACAVLISGFVALTLSPMMASRLLKRGQGHGPIGSRVERGFLAMTRGYTAALRVSLKLRWVVLLLAIGVAVFCYWLYGQTKRELSPVEDRSTIVVIFNGPDGASIDYTTKYAKAIEGIAGSFKEIDRRFLVVGNPTVTQGISFLRMEDWDLRTRSVQDIIKELQPRLGGIPGITAFAVAPASLGQSPRERPINVVLISSDEYTKMQGVVQRILGDLQKNPLLTGVDTDLRLNKPEIRLRVDRDKAADAGVSVDAIGRTLESMLGGRQVTRFKRGGEQYDVIVQLGSADRNTPDDISNIFVRGRGDSMIPLSSLVTVDETVSPRDLNHFGQRRAVTISANLGPNASLGEALEVVETTAQKYMTAGWAMDYNGQTREFKKSSSALVLTFALAIIFIYLVLAAQFESFVDPFIILFTVPLSMTGAFLALQWSGGTLNVYSQIGLITLVGLITKHGILIVEFANQLQEQGRTKSEAVLQSASLRLRPILMTTGAMVLGAIPLALATGAGAESRRQIGWVIVGGMTFGTLLTLFVVPPIYTLIGRTHKKLRDIDGVEGKDKGTSKPDVAPALNTSAVAHGTAAVAHSPTNAPKL
jgi:multidrug efflux pump